MPAAVKNDFLFPDRSPQGMCGWAGGESQAFTATFVQPFLTVNNLIMCCPTHNSSAPPPHEELLCTLGKVSGSVAIRAQ